MPRGRILESLAFITGEMNEFEADYASKNWKEYSSDNKLQKLIDRTIENVLTAFIEVSGAILTENDVEAESYSDVMVKIGRFFGFGEEDVDCLARFAIQRNRLAHRYLNFRWQVVRFYMEKRGVLKRLAQAIDNYEKIRG